MNTLPLDVWENLGVDGLDAVAQLSLWKFRFKLSSSLNHTWRTFFPIFIGTDVSFDDVLLTLIHAASLNFLTNHVELLFPSSGR